MESGLIEGNKKYTVESVALSFGAVNSYSYYGTETAPLTVSAPALGSAPQWIASTSNQLDTSTYNCLELRMHVLPVADAIPGAADYSAGGCDGQQRRQGKAAKTGINKVQGAFLSRSSFFKQHGGALSGHYMKTPLQSIYSFI